MEIVQKCNVCGSDVIRPIDSAWHLCCCVGCGFVFDSPRPTLEEVAEFYSKPTKYDSWIDQSGARDALWQRRLKKLLPYCTKGNLLDIGTGIGQFLQHAKPYFTEVYGTEISESAVRIAHSRYGLDIYQGSVEDLDLPSSSFDNITLFHILEHVPDPSRMIAICWRLLRQGGTLLIAVPNDILAWTSVAKRAGKVFGFPQFEKFSPKAGLPRVGSSREIHLSHFTPAVLRRLVESYAFSILEESLDPYYVARGLKWALHASYYGLHKLLFSLAHVNRYDTILVVARKQSLSLAQRPSSCSVA